MAMPHETPKRERAKTRLGMRETGEELVQRIKRGDEQAFPELHARYRSRVNAFALRRVPNPFDAEDITQEVFLQIHRSLESFQGRSGLSTWIFGIAHNVVGRFYRKQHGARVPLEGAEVDARLSYRPGTERRIDAWRAIEHCDATLERSRPPEHQRIFELFYGNGQSMRVIAEMCGRPTESVKDSLRRSRDLLLRDVPELRQALQAARSEQAGTTDPKYAGPLQDVA
jgi:RNA polymerase sigma-70 factor (ECF subfamily)